MKCLPADDSGELKILAYSPVFWATLAGAVTLSQGDPFTWIGRGLAAVAIWHGIKAGRSMTSSGVSRESIFRWVVANLCAGVGLQLVGLESAAVSCLAIALLGLFGFSERPDRKAAAPN